jgi:molybdate transport system substrate-binding protein
MSLLGKSPDVDSIRKPARRPRRKNLMGRRYVSVFAILALLTISAHAAFAADILVFAAASLTNAMQQLGPPFSAKTGTHVSFSFGSSGTLARQITAGAPADVFFSADQPTMLQVEASGRINKAEVRNLLSNRLVVVIPADSTLTISAASDLSKVGSIATGDPKSVPVGIYAKAWLESLHMWDSLAPHIIPALDVRAALAAVETQAAKAGIVYATDAAISKRVKVAFVVPEDQTPPIVYPVAPIADSKELAAAKSFVDFLAGDSARAVFENLGFKILQH